VHITEKLENLFGHDSMAIFIVMTGSSEWEKIQGIGLGRKCGSEINQGEVEAPHDPKNQVTTILIDQLWVGVPFVLRQVHEN
jgi:hypothetical protein